MRLEIGNKAWGQRGNGPKRWKNGWPVYKGLSSVQLLSCIWLFATSWTTARQASLSITNSQSLLKLMSIESVMASSHLILCHPLLFLPPIPPSIRVFSNESTLRMRWPKNWSFSFSISPSNEHPGLTSFRMDWLDLLAVQGTLKSLFQHHSPKASIFWRSAFFTVQLSHPHMTTGKTTALTRQTFVGKIMSLLFRLHRPLWVLWFLLWVKTGPLWGFEQRCWYDLFLFWWVSLAAVLRMDCWVAMSGRREISW